MIQNINGSTEKFLADLNRIQATNLRVQRQITSGLKVELPSDAPDAIRGILQLKTAIQQNTQIQTNLGTAKDAVTGADTALQSAISLLDQATQLGAQGATSTATADTRAILAQQVDGLLGSMVGLSRTAVSGRYIFSGDQDGAPAYELNAANQNGVNRLLTSANTLQVQDARGTAFAVGKTAQEIFDHRNADDTLAADNVFAAVNGLKTALQNNDTAAIATSMDAVRTAGSYLNSQLSFYGAAENRIQAAMTDASNLQTQEKSSLTGLEDTDLAAASTELALSSTQEQAALQARAKLPQTSLFNYLA